MADPVTTEAVTLSQFLASAAHDIKQPLNVLQMYLGLLQRRSGSDTPDELNQVVHESLRTLQALLNLLSQWARADQGGLKQQPHPVNETEWLELLESLKGVDRERASGSCPPLAAEFAQSVQAGQADESRTADLMLLRQIVEDLVQLLPKPVQLCHERPWSLTLQSAVLLRSTAAGERHYRDALYQLATAAGAAITAAMGLHLSIRHQSEPEQTKLTLSLLQDPPRYPEN
jgi:hypothetical protein